MFSKIKSLFSQETIRKELKDLSKHKRSLLTLFILLVFGAGLQLWHASTKSATYDEIGHAQCGFYHWQHFDFDRGLEHPPLIRLIAAFPLNFLNLEDPIKTYSTFREKTISVRKEQLYGTIWMYKNKNGDADQILLLSRSMIILITLMLSLLVFVWSKELYGETGGWISLFLMTSTPALIAHGSLVTTDVGGVATAMLFLYLFNRFLLNPSHQNLVLTGLTLGVAQVSKLSNIFLIPLFIFLFAFLPSTRGIKIGKKVGYLIVALLLCGLVINASYAFQNFIPPHLIHPDDLKAYGWNPLTQWVYKWLPLPDFYLLSLGFMTHHVRQGFNIFLMGEFYPKGAWYYFPLIFLLRTPIMSILCISAAFYSLRKKMLNQSEFVLLITAFCYTLIVSFSKLNLGIRHYLLMYPILFIFSGRLSQYSFVFHKRKWILAGLIFVQLLELFYVSPHFLSFFNFAVGGPKAGIHYTSDTDNGQDLKLLGKFMTKHPDADLILSYFGTALPQYYGMNAQELAPTGTMLSSNQINSDVPKKEFLAISASHLQGHMAGPNTFKWLRDKKPETILGYSIYVYDITSDIESHKNIAAIYKMRNEDEKSLRHMKRIEILMKGRNKPNNVN